MLKVVVSHEARLDQIDLADYLEQQAGDTLAERLFQDLEDAFQNLALMPGMGLHAISGCRSCEACGCGRLLAFRI